MNMKKPLLGAIGVAGACAACCAIPLAIPLIAGMSAGGLASVLGSEGLSLGAIVGAALGAALLVGAGLWWSRRRKAAACQVGAATSVGSACSIPLTTEAGARSAPATGAPSCDCSGRRP